MPILFLSYKRLIRGLLRNELSWDDLENALFYLDLDRDNVFRAWPPHERGDFRLYAEHFLFYRFHFGPGYRGFYRFTEVSTVLQAMLAIAERQGRVCWMKPATPQHSRRSLHRLLRRNGYEPKDDRLRPFA